MFFEVWKNLKYVFSNTAQNSTDSFIQVPHTGTNAPISSL